jgi:hypothetical protein
MLIINQQRLTAQQCDLDVRDCQSHRLSVTSVTSLEESALAHVRSVLRPSARPQTKADVIVPSDVCAAKKRKGNAPLSTFRLIVTSSQNENHIIESHWHPPYFVFVHGCRVLWFSHLQNDRENGRKISTIQGIIGHAQPQN